MPNLQQATQHTVMSLQLLRIYHTLPIVKQQHQNNLSRCQKTFTAMACASRLSRMGSAGDRNAQRRPPVGRR